MRELTCSRCGKVVMLVQMKDFGFAIVFCVACAKDAVHTGLIAKFSALSQDGGYIVQPSREPV
jgi:hypothetical protein